MYAGEIQPFVAAPSVALSPTHRVLGPEGRKSLFRKIVNVAHVQFNFFKYEKWEEGKGFGFAKIFLVWKGIFFVDPIANWNDRYFILKTK